MLTHQGTKTLETDRLILRILRIEDAQPMFDNWASDPEVTKFLTWPAHENLQVTQAVLGSWLDEYGRNDFYQWAIELKQIGKPVGTISVVSYHTRIKKSGDWLLYRQKLVASGDYDGGAAGRDGLSF